MDHGKIIVAQSMSRKFLYNNPRNMQLRFQGEDPAFKFHATPINEEQDE
jgi:hypothetical protein